MTRKTSVGALALIALTVIRLRRPAERGHGGADLPPPCLGTTSSNWQRTHDDAVAFSAFGSDEHGCPTARERQRRSVTPAT